MRLAVVTGILLALACGGGASDEVVMVGGPCEYEPYEGTCTLEYAIADDAVDGTVDIFSEWHGARDAEWRVPADQAKAAMELIEAPGGAPCKGQKLTSGSCAPPRMTVHVKGLEAFEQ